MGDSLEQVGTGVPGLQEAPRQEGRPRIPHYSPGKIVGRTSRRTTVHLFGRFAQILYKNELPLCVSPLVL